MAKPPKSLRTRPTLAPANLFQGSKKRPDSASQPQKPAGVQAPLSRLDSRDHSGDHSTGTKLPVTPPNELSQALAAAARREAARLGARDLPGRDGVATYFARPDLALPDLALQAAPPKKSRRPPRDHEDWDSLDDFSSFDDPTGLPCLAHIPVNRQTHADVRHFDHLAPLAQVPLLQPGADPDWLWPARIRRGELTLLAGDIGSGKSFLACDLAARLSSGRPWPDAPPDAPAPSPAPVLLVVGQESHPHVLKDRLHRLGADPSRVQVLRLVQENSPTENSFVRNFSADQDLGLLSRHLLEHADTQLVILDSFDRLAGPRRSPAVIRRILARLQTIAATSGAAIVLTKSYSHPPRPGRHLRALGSMVFADSLRSLWAIEPLVSADDDTEPDPAGAARATHRLVPLKVNDFERSTALDFRLKDHRVEWLGAPRDCPALHHGDDPARARRKSERSLLTEATDFLRSLLEAGPVPAVALRQQTEQSGLAWRTVQRAKEQLGIQSSMSRLGDDHFWSWWLPGTPPVRSPEMAIRDWKSLPSSARRGPPPAEGSPGSRRFFRSTAATARAAPETASEASAAASARSQWPGGRLGIVTTKEVLSGMTGGTAQALESWPAQDFSTLRREFGGTTGAPPAATHPAGSAAKHSNSVSEPDVVVSEAQPVQSAKAPVANGATSSLGGSPAEVSAVGGNVGETTTAGLNSPGQTRGGQTGAGSVAGTQIGGGQTAGTPPVETQADDGATLRGATCETFPAAAGNGGRLALSGGSGGCWGAVPVVAGGEGLDLPQRRLSKKEKRRLHQQRSQLVHK